MVRERERRARASLPSFTLPPAALTTTSLPSLSRTGTGRNFEVWKGFLCQGGDIVNGDGTGGESIYDDGGPFEDEFSTDLRFHAPGMLAMAGTYPMRTQGEEERMHRPNTNTSQFFITTKERNHAQGGCTILHFNDRHVIFGRVVQGIQSVQAINRLNNGGPGQMHQLLEEVIIAECGQLKSKEEEAMEAEAAKYAKTEKREDTVYEEEVLTVAEAVEAALAEPPPPKPKHVPTEEDLAIQSAEVDDD